jgi:glycosyltransferase involved in cell wall biosynthesis
VEGLGVPSKLYTSLAAGQVILALVGENSEVANIIGEYHCGFRVDQGDVEGVVKALRNLYEDNYLLKKMKKNARRCFEENFTQEQAISKYYKIISAIH